MESSSTDRPDGIYLIGSNTVTDKWVAQQAIDNHQALHNPGELAVLVRMMDTHLPKTILEIGTWAGGSAWAWSRIRSVEHIVTVDVSPQPAAAARLASLPCKVTQVTGISAYPETRRRVLEALDGTAPEIVVIDGGHTYQEARADWNAYGTMVAVGGMVVFHDTQGYPGNDTVQVPQLWAEIRGAYRTTELVDMPGGPGGTGIVWM